jgi:hypothetical protein
VEGISSKAVLFINHLQTVVTLIGAAVVVELDTKSIFVPSRPFQVTIEARVAGVIPIHFEDEKPEKLKTSRGLWWERSRGRFNGSRQGQVENRGDRKGNFLWVRRPSSDLTNLFYQTPYLLLLLIRSCACDLFPIIGHAFHSVSSCAEDPAASARLREDSLGRDICIRGQVCFSEASHEKRQSMTLENIVDNNLARWQTS